MINSVPRSLKRLADKLSVPLYITGGAVRNYLAGLFLSDFDICSELSPQEFCQVATLSGFVIKAVYDATYTVKLASEGQEFEYASFRTEDYTRGHTPSTATLTKDITKDALRRDFKCNAIYFDIKNQKFIDILGGRQDIKNKVVSTVKNAQEVFKNDGLRILRLARLCGELGFTAELDTLEAATQNRDNLKDIKSERIFNELMLILQADLKNNIKDGHYYALKILDETRALDIILPEIAAGRGITQRKDFHNFDVLEHSLRAAKYADAEIRLAALMHDVGKPHCYNLKGNFYGHDKIGAEIAVSVLKRLKAPLKTIAAVKKLTLLHMYDNDLMAKSNKIKKFIIKNYSVYRQLLKLKQADFSASKDDLREAPVVIKWEKIRTDMINSGVPLALSDLKIGGGDLVELGLEKKQIKDTLEELFWLCVESPEKNEKNGLILKAQAIKEKKYLN